MDCYMESYTACPPGPSGADNLCSRQLLAQCDHEYSCGDSNLANAQGDVLNPGYKLTSNVQFDPSCDSYKALIQQQLQTAVGRFQDCLNYGFVKKNIADRMQLALAASNFVLSISCVEPPNPIWCGAASPGGGIMLSPSKMLTPGSICYPDMGAYIIHRWVTSRVSR